MSGNERKPASSSSNSESLSRVWTESLRLPETKSLLGGARDVDPSSEVTDTKAKSWEVSPTASSSTSVLAKRTMMGGFSVAPGRT